MLRGDCRCGRRSQVTERSAFRASDAQSGSWGSLADLNEAADAAAGRSGVVLGE